MSELPKGWIIDSISNTFELTRDKGLTGVTPYLEIGNININNKKYSFTDKKSVKGCKKAIKGDVLISRVRPTRGAIAQVKEKRLEVSSAFTILRNTYGFNGKYLWYYLAWNDDYLNYLGFNCTGTMYPTVSENIAVNYKIPIAPLNEQRRIIAKLERLLHKVDACKERLEKIPAILKRFRQSVLSAACSGRLTADWRKKNPNVQPYSVGFQRASDTEYKDDDFPVTWHLTRFGTLTMLVTSGSRGWAKYYADSGLIFIRAQNIKSDFLNFEDIAFVKLPDRAEGLRTRVQQHDILVTITGANVTKSALVEKPIKDAYVSQHVALVRLADVQLSKFLFYYIISLAHGRKQLQTVAYGQGKPGLNLDNIREVIVAVPPLPEQQEIVRRVEALFKKADEIEARYKKAKAFVDKLTQSILVKAFRGELVPQDPNDESASVLLERIREANTINLQKKRKKSKLEKEKR